MVKYGYIINDKEVFVDNYFDLPISIRSIGCNNPRFDGTDDVIINV